LFVVHIFLSKGGRILSILKSGKELNQLNIYFGTKNHTRLIIRKSLTVDDKIATGYRFLPKNKIKRDIPSINSKNQGNIKAIYETSSNLIHSPFIVEKEAKP